jgi:hypothetical protein
LTSRILRSVATKDPPPVSRRGILRRYAPQDLALIGILVVAYADILFAGRGLFLHDITLYHYPLKHVVREVISHGVFPFWNRYLSGGQPLAANPAYEVFYPLQWPIFLPSFHFGFQLHIWLHFVLAALGMYRLARALGCGVHAAMFAAITFVFCGPYLSLSSKLPLLFSYSWMPWTLAFCLGGGQPPSAVPLTIALAMQLLLGEPTVFLQTLILVLGYAIVKRRAGLLVPIALAAGLAAIQLIPSIDFARDTVRSEPFPFEVVSNWSTPPSRALELLVPHFFDRILGDNGKPLITAMYPFRVEAFLPDFYLGIATLVLALAGIFAWRRGAGWVLAIVAGFGLLAIGERTPVLHLLYDLGMKSIRYPEKFMLAPALALIAWSAVVLEDLLGGDARIAKKVKVVAIAGAILATVIALAQAHVDSRWYTAEVIARVAIVAAVLMWRRSAMVLVGITALDVWSATLHLVPRMPRNYFDPAPIAAQIPPTGRVYPEASWDWWDGSPIATIYFGSADVEQYWWAFRNGGFVYLPMYWGRELALEDDVDRTSLRNTDQLREALKRARAQHADEPYLKMAGIHSLLRFAPVTEAASLQPTEVVLTEKNPRYSLSEGAVTAVDESDNHVRLSTKSTARGTLTIRVTAHRYWSATVDGQPATLQPANIAYQSLDLEPGTHVIEMRYRNPMIAVGALVTLLAAIALALERRWLPRLP